MKTFLMRTAIKKLKEGKTIKIANKGNRDVIYRTRKNNTEVWFYSKTLDKNWLKLGTLKEFIFYDNIFGIKFTEVKQ